MACSGSHCAEHGTGTTTCAGHRAACSTNRAITLSAEYTVGGKITAADINTLRSNIRAELDRYDDHRSFAGNVTLREGTVYNTDTKIDNDQINNMERMVRDVLNVTEPVGTSYARLSDPVNLTTAAVTLAEGTQVTKAHWDDLKARYDTIRQDCICNSDCSCNLVCSCHNNCGCNYSDERLKENIKFVEVRNGLNVYSWNYLWDKTTSYVGVIAQELLGTIHEVALTKDTRGFYMVNYSKLPI